MSNIKMIGRGSSISGFDLFFAADLIITSSDDAIFSTNDSGGFLEFIGKFKLDDSGNIVSGKINKINVHASGFSYSISTSLNYNDLIAMSDFDLSDFIYSGNNTITGTAGNDFVLINGAGKDKISLGSGKDFFWGVDSATIDLGSGDDFVVLSNFSNVKLGTGSDIVRVSTLDVESKVIKDFSSTEDIIEISQSFFSDMQLQEFYWDGESNFLEFFESQVRVGQNSHLSLRADQFLAYDMKSGKIYFDEDGGGQGVAPVLIAILANKPNITPKMLADDIVVLSGVLSDYTGLSSDFILSQ